MNIHIGIPKVAFTLQANWRSGAKRGEARRSDVQRSVKAEISKHKRIRHCLWNKMAYLRSQTRRMFLVENSFLKVVNRQQRRFWIHEINLCRQEYGEYHHLMPQLRRHEVKFKEYMRMNTATFDCLLELIREDIEKSTTNFRRPISAEERLVVTLR